MILTVSFVLYLPDAFMDFITSLLRQLSLRLLDLNYVIIRVYPLAWTFDRDLRHLVLCYADKEQCTKPTTVCRGLYFRSFFFSAICPSCLSLSCCSLSFLLSVYCVHCFCLFRFIVSPFFLWTKALG